MLCWNDNAYTAWIGFVWYLFFTYFLDGVSLFDSFSYNLESYKFSCFFSLFLYPQRMNNIL